MLLLTVSLSRLSSNSILIFQSPLKSRGALRQKDPDMPFLQCLVTSMTNCWSVICFAHPVGSTIPAKRSCCKVSKPPGEQIKMFDSLWERG